MNEPRTAMGFIETIGLVAAIAAADGALKSANVKLIGRENSRGNGMVTVKISGDVGAVKAAVAAAVAAVKPFGTVVSAQVIARPALGFGPVMVYNADTKSAAAWLADMASGSEGVSAVGQLDALQGEVEREKSYQSDPKGRRKRSSRKKAELSKEENASKEAQSRKPGSRRRRKTASGRKTENPDISNGETAGIEEEKSPNSRPDMATDLESSEKPEITLEITDGKD